MILHGWVVAIVVCVVRTQPLHSLQRVIDYGLAHNISDMNFLIGVAIVRGQLHVVEKYITDYDDKSKSDLKHLQSKCDDLLQTAQDLEDPLSGILYPQLWVQDSPLQPPSQPTFPLSLFDGSASLTPPLSDTCLRSVFTGCSLPTECILAEVTTASRGYPLTHQVLFWTIFNQVCRNFPVGAIIRHKCGAVIAEHQDISSQGLHQLLDLYFEQVVICGLHGFLPLNLEIDQQILLSLQTSVGCFSLRKTGNEQLCDIHLSGVAAAALSLIIKYNVKGQI